MQITFNFHSFNGLAKQNLISEFERNKYVINFYIKIRLEIMFFFCFMGKNLNFSRTTLYSAVLPFPINVELRDFFYQHELVEIYV